MSSPPTRAHGVVIQGRRAAATGREEPDRHRREWGRLANNGSGVVIIDASSNTHQRQQIRVQPGIGRPHHRHRLRPSGVEAGGNLVASNLMGQRAPAIGITASPSSTPRTTRSRPTRSSGAASTGSPSSAEGPVATAPRQQHHHQQQRRRREHRRGTPEPDHDNTIEQNGNDGVELSGQGTPSTTWRPTYRPQRGSTASGSSRPTEHDRGRQHISGNGSPASRSPGTRLGRSSRGTSSAPMRTAGRPGAMAGQPVQPVGVLLNETSCIVVGGGSGVLGALQPGKDNVLATGANIIAGNDRTGVQISGTSSMVIRSRTT